MARPAQSQSRPAFWVSAAVLVALVFCAYFPALFAGFIWDDDHYVTRNPVLHQPGGLWRIWFDIGATPQYYPLVHTSFWIESRLYGFSAAGFHFVNIALHAAAAVLLWRVLKRLAVPGAWLAAALFAVHPVGVESVAWVTERKNVLSGFFYFAAALVYLRWSERSSALAATPSAASPHAAESPQRDEPGAAHARAGRWPYVLALVLFICALLSKTVTASLPAALLLVTWWKHGRLTRRHVLPTLPMFAIGAALAALTVWMERFEVGAEGPDWHLSLADRFLVAGRACWFYLGKLLWPHPLVFIYPRWEIDDRQLWQYAFPVAAAALVAALSLLRRRIGRGPLAGTLFFGGTLLPALGFFNVYPMRFSFVADHFQYLAVVGPLSLIAAAIVRLVPPGRPRAPDAVGSVKVRAIVVAGLLIGLGTLTWRQTLIYRNAETIWRHTLKHNPDCWLARANLARFLADSGRLDEALAHADIKRQARPDLPNSHSGYADILMAIGRVDEAAASYQKALSIDPRYLRANMGLAETLRKQGRPLEAIPRLQRILENHPRFALAWLRLAQCHEAAGQSAEALRHFQKALELSPNHPDALFGIGRAFYLLNDLPRAAEAFKQAIRVSTGFVEAYNGLALTHAAAGQLDEAFIILDEALRIDPRFVRARFNRARLLQSRGRPAEAAAEYETILKLDPGNPEAAQHLADLRHGSAPTSGPAPHARP